MSTDKHAHPVEHFEAGLAWARERVAGVRPEQLDDPTPCADWTVRQLVQHLVDVVETLPRALGSGTAEPPQAEGGQPGADDVEAALAELDRAAAEAHGLLEDEAGWHRRLASPVGPMPALRLVMVTFGDLVVHGWDLARATGQDEVMPERLAETAYTVWRQMPLEHHRTGGAIAAQVEVAEDARTQDKLLALLGRTP